MKKLQLILLLLVASLFASAQTIEQTYHYNQAIISEHDGYQQIGLQGCLPLGIVGEPMLPWQNVSLILPQGQEAVAIHVEFLDFVELDGVFNLYPYQQPRPLSNKKEIPFAKDEALYRSNAVYPTHSFSSVNTQYLNGVALAFSGFTPVQYVPATGKVSYAKTVKVSIETTMSRDDHSRKLWLTPENEASIKRLAQNESVLSTYTKRGRSIGGYDMLVITSEEWIPSFADYLALYNNKGIRTRIVSLEEIYATMEGRDEPEQIRNYIIQEYESNGIQMVSLGGDVSIVPFRFLYCWAQEGEEDQLPSDMYYACLDGTLNDDDDDRWGEVGEDDLLPELGIGRLPFNNETQFENIMHKTFSYLQIPVLGEFTSPILGAEHLGDGYYGSDDMERLIGENNDFDYTTYGYPEDYNFKKYYATPHLEWSAADFKRVICSGGQYVHHVGHANTDYVAGWETSTITDNYFSGNDGINHNYMLFHSHGCICGNFPFSCILEKMVTVKTGFVACTGNSRYGWYVPWGDGMAAHIHREFVDAYCNDHIAILGMALREAKIATAPWVTTMYGDNGCLRWNIYCLNVLGDGALAPWFAEPFTPNVSFEKGLKVGTTTTTVHVDKCGMPLDNFRVTLFHGDEMLAIGITDSNGDALLTFDPAMDRVGELKLIVTGQNAWPQILEVTGIDGSEPFVYGNIIDIENGALYGSQHHVAIELFNKGDVAAHGVRAVITTDCEYITSYESNYIIGEMAGNSNEILEQGGLIDIADNIPDQTLFTLNLTTSSQDTEDITTQRSFVAIAPNLQFADIELEETFGDGDGFVDPGEQGVIHITGKNLGHTLAPEAYLTVSYVEGGIHISETTYPIGNVDMNGNFSIDINVDTDTDIISGTTFHLDLCLHTGAYATNYDYSFGVGLAIETFESGDFSYLSWEHAGNQHWFVTDEESHSGSYCARSGEIGNRETSELVAYADVLQNGEISFWLKTSSEYNKDVLAFYLDGKLKDWWSGQSSEWTYAHYTFEAGSHVFKWVYDKNINGSSGQDCVWIDDITFPRTCYITGVEEVVTPSTNALYPNPTNGSFTIQLAEESNVSIFNTLGQNVMNLDKVNGSQQLNLGESGIYFVRISNANGVEVKKLVVE